MIPASSDGSEGPSFAPESLVFDPERVLDGAVQATADALNLATVAVAIIDEDMRWVLVNAATAAINGVAASDHIGRTVHAVVGETGSNLEPLFREVMASGVAKTDVEVFGALAARPDEPRAWRASYLPHRLAPGSVEEHGADSILSVFVEVTQERRAELRLRQVIDGLFSFVGLCDVDGTLREANQTALQAAGIEAAEVLGRPFWECFWWLHDPVAQRTIREAVERAASGETCRFDTSVQVAGGRLLPIDFQLVPVVEEGVVIALVPSGIDITDRITQLNGLSDLASLSADMHSTTGVHELISMIVARAEGMFSSSLVTLALLDQEAGVIHVTNPAHLDRDVADRWTELALDGPRTPYHDAVEQGRAIWIMDQTSRRDRYPAVADDSDRLGFVVTAALPLRDGRSVVGVLGLGWTAPIGDDATVRLHSALFADICAQAMQRVNRVRTQTMLVRTLSDQLMSRTDTATELDIAVRYQPAVSEIGFGGDWYDVVTLSDTTTALIVGDVAGHNVEAAANMAVARTSLRTAVIAHPDLAHLGDLLHQTLAIREREFFGTALVVVVDTDRREVRWKSFGHLPAVVLAADGTVTLLASNRPPIGLLSDTGPIGTCGFEPGSKIVLYTDGLIENRFDPLDGLVEGLAHTIGSSQSADAESLVQHLMAELVTARIEDDVAVVAAIWPESLAEPPDSR